MLVRLVLVGQACKNHIASNQMSALEQTRLWQNWGAELARFLQIAMGLSLSWSITCRSCVIWACWIARTRSNLQAN